MASQAAPNSTSEGATMKAVLWEGHPYHMVVRDVPRPQIQNSTDVLVRTTTAAICGTDLHTYHGILGGSDVPYQMGHEAVGIVEEVGAEVRNFKVGDRVIVPDGNFNPSNEFLYGIGNLLARDAGGCQSKLEPALSHPNPSIEPCSAQAHGNWYGIFSNRATQLSTSSFL